MKILTIFYGPVSSWRLGKSLGIDLICEMKVCSFDCTYCSLGETTEETIDRKIFTKLQNLQDEFKKIPDEIDPDVLTFSGTGEPTLAKNLGEGIKFIKRVSDLPVAVLTNSSLMYSQDVREDLSNADIVIGSLDASNEEIFQKINRPHPNLDLQNIISGMKKFGKKFDGEFLLELMFVQKNRKFSEDIAKIVEEINPDEVQINTPLRKNPAEPLSQTELKKVQKEFQNLKTQNVYEAQKKEVKNQTGLEKLKVLKRG